MECKNCGSNRVVAKGLCDRCYRRDLTSRKKTICSYCDKPAVVSGLCNTCYMRQRRSGTWIRKQVRKSGSCTHCGKLPQRAKGLCNTCYMRQRRNEPNSRQCQQCQKKGLYAKGLCRNCYSRQLRKAKQSVGR